MLIDSVVASRSITTSKPSKQMRPLQHIVMWSGTLYGRSFTFGEDPYEEHEEHAEEHEEITGKNERDTQPTRDQSHKV